MSRLKAKTSPCKKHIFPSDLLLASRTILEILYKLTRNKIFVTFVPNLFNLILFLCNMKKLSLWQNLFEQRCCLLFVETFFEKIMQNKESFSERASFFRHC